MNIKKIEAYKRSMSLVSNAKMLIQISLKCTTYGDKIRGKQCKLWIRYKTILNMLYMKCRKFANTIMEAYYLLLYNILSQITIVYVENCLNQRFLPLLLLSN